MSLRKYSFYYLFFIIINSVDRDFRVIFEGSQVCKEDGHQCTGWNRLSKLYKKGFTKDVEKVTNQKV